MNKNKIFLYQTMLSGNVNGDWNITEDFESKKELKNHFIKLYPTVFNIIEIKPKSKIGDYDYAYNDPNYKKFNEEDKS